jgi:hypothetical protein
MELSLCFLEQLKENFEELVQILKRDQRCVLLLSLLGVECDERQSFERGIPCKFIS